MSLIFLIFIFVGSGYALETRYRNDQGYNNKVGYNNQTGYNNKLPYRSFFSAPEPEKIKVQTRDGRQAVIPINQKEEKIVQKGIDK